MPLEIQISRVTLLALVALAAPMSADADVTVQELGTLNIADVNVHTTSIVQIAGEKERTESDLRCQGIASLLCAKDQQIDIVRLDRGVSWKLEPKKKHYIETSLPTEAARRSAAERSRNGSENIKSCPQSHPAVVDISKCELSDPIASMEMTNDVATLAGQNAKRTIFKLTQACKNLDPSKACEVAYSFEVWLAPEDTAGLRERHAFEHRYLALLGADGDSLASPPQFNEYLAPYHAALKRLAQSSGELKGYPLKTTFRLIYSGQPCVSAHSSLAGERGSSAISGASEAATQATSNSAQHAVGWGTADAMQRSTGSGVAGYVAGSAAGAFAGSMVSGLFAKKAKPPPTSSNSLNPTKETDVTLLEFSLETTLLSADPLPAGQFEAPNQWAKVSANTSGKSESPSCPTSTL